MITRSLALHCCLLISGPALLAGGEPGTESAAPAAADKGASTESAQRHQLLTDMLSGAVLEGSYTVSGQPLTQLQQERYEIRQIAKLPEGDFWLFHARIRYGDHDVTVPIPLQIKWVDQTPVITLDKVTLPGLGTFSARVLFADQKYAGTWQHDAVGGHLFGTIERAPGPVDP